MPAGIWRLCQGFGYLSFCAPLNPNILWNKYTYRIGSWFTLNSQEVWQFQSGSAKLLHHYKYYKSMGLKIASITWKNRQEEAETWKIISRKERIKVGGMWLKIIEFRPKWKMSRSRDRNVWKNGFFKITFWLSACELTRQKYFFFDFFADFRKIGVISLQTKNLSGQPTVLLKNISNILFRFC